MLPPVYLYALPNDATAVRNNDSYIIRTAPTATRRILVPAVIEKLKLNQERIRQERAAQARAKRKAELEKKVAQLNRGRDREPSPILAMMDVQNLQTPEAAELARMNREDEAAQSAYINSFPGWRKAIAWLQTVMGASGADMLNPGMGAGLAAHANPVMQIESMIRHMPGYHIKSLQRGNVLEKQLSKQGTISTNSIRALADNNNTSEVDRYILGRVLDNHAGEKAIDYNTLRQEAQGMIPKYSRVPLTEYADYGVQRLGYKPIEIEKYSEEFKKHAEDRANKLIKYANKYYLGTDPIRYRRLGSIAGSYRNMAHGRHFLLTKNGEIDYGANLNTFTFESPGIHGNTKHYSGNPIGHSRTYTTYDEPDVLHVMESQSDWGQGKLDKPYRTFSTQYLNDPEAYKKFIDGHKQLLKKMQANPDDYVEDAIERQIENIRHHEAILDQILHSKGDPIKNRMHDNYPQRQLQENMLYAAQRGQKRMRYPTSETAAKIEGYTGQPVAIDNFGVRQNPHDYWTYPGDNIDWYKGFNLPEGWKLKTVYSPGEETILKKYSDFPKLFDKTFKGQQVRTVNDKLGNSWYEVDIPEDMLNRELIFSFANPFGQINSMNEQGNRRLKFPSKKTK